MHGTTLQPCLSYCFPCNAWRNVSQSKLGKAFFFDKNSRTQKPARVEEKRERKNFFFLIESGCLRFGYVAENKILSIKETRAYYFIFKKEIHQPF